MKGMSYLTQSHSSLKQLGCLRDRSSACTILTGNSLLNHIEGLYSNKFIHPKVSLALLRDFESRYLIKESKDINVKGILRTIQITVGHRNLEELRSRLEEICITRNIKYNIIPKFYSVELAPGEIYEDLFWRLLKDLRELLRPSFLLIRLLIYRRQWTLVMKEYPEWPKASNKEKKLLQILSVVLWIETSLCFNLL